MTDKSAPSSLKVLLVIPTLACGGAEVLVCNLAMALQDAGHRVLVLCNRLPEKSYEMIPNKEKLEQSIEIRYTNDVVRFRFLRKPIFKNEALKEILETFQPDVIHSNLFLAEVYSRSYLSPTATYVTHVHDNMFQLERPGWKVWLSKQKLTAAWERMWLLGKYRESHTRFIAISPDVKQFLENALPQSRQHIHLLPNAIDLQRFCGRKTDFVSDGVLRMVSVGSLVKKKNHQLLIQLAVLMKEANLLFEIHIYGDGVLRESLQQQTTFCGVQEQVFFHGNSPEVATHMHRADVYVHPATYEPFGLVLLEAMASGLPVISLDGFGNRELIQDGENGFLLPNQADASALLEKILWLMADKQRMVLMAEKGLAFSKNFGMEAYVQKMLACYQSPNNKK